MPLITTTAYFPPAHWFTSAARLGEWRLERHETYQRRGFRNRALIGGPNKVLTLSVPLVKGKNQRTPITEVMINEDTDWRREHVQSIRSAYGRAPFYDFYAEGVYECLLRGPANLYDLNLSLLRTITDQLGLPIELSATESFLGDAGLAEPNELAPYPQVFTDRFGYRGGLSILDALFCLGPGFITHPTVHSQTTMGL